MEDELAEAAGRSRREPLATLRVALRRWPPTRRLALVVERLAAVAVLLRYRPAVVWLNTVLSSVYVAPGRRLGIPVVLHVHELAPAASPVLERYGLRRRLGPLGVRVVACSGVVRDHVLELCGLPPERVSVIHSVPDRERVLRMAEEGGSAPSDGRTVVSCGTADTGKGVDVWLDAAGRVVARPGMGDVRFVWVGRCPDDTLLAPVDPAVLRRVDFVGELANPYPVVAAATVFTLLSRRDSFPLAVLEAMALSRPVVVADAGGMPDQVGNDGVVVPAEDAGAAAEAVLALLGDAPARLRLGEAAAERVTGIFGDDRFAAAVAAEAGAAVLSGSARDGGRRT